MQKPKNFGQAVISNTATSIYTAPTSGIIADLVTNIYISNVTMIEPSKAPTVTMTGSGGSTSYTYSIVAKDKWGQQTYAGPPTTITNGNATLSASNYNAISWSAVPDAATYDILKGVSGNTAISTGNTGTSFNDVGGSTSAYTLPAMNLSGQTIYANVYVVQSGNSFGQESQIIARGIEIDTGQSIDLTINQVLDPGDSIYALAYVGLNGDNSGANLAVINLNGVEFS